MFYERNESNARDDEISRRLRSRRSSFMDSPIVAAVQIGGLVLLVRTVMLTMGMAFFSIPYLDPFLLNLLAQLRVAFG